MFKTIKLLIKFDEEYQEGDMAVVEVDRGDEYLANVIYDANTIAEIYEQLMGSEIE